MAPELRKRMNLVDAEGKRHIVCQYQAVMRNAFGATSGDGTLYWESSNDEQVEQIDDHRFKIKVDLEWVEATR